MSTDAPARPTTSGAVWHEDDVDPWPRERAENRYERHLFGEDDHA